MTTHDEQTLNDIDDLLILAGGYLTALKQFSKAPNKDKLVKITEKTIERIAKRYRKQIDELYADAAPNPEGLTLKK